MLVIAEHQDGQLNPSTARAVSAAQALSPQSIDIVVLAADPAAVATQAAQIADVARVLTVEGSLAARQHIGGTAPTQVRAAIARARAALA